MDHTVEVIGLALDASLMRQTAIAANVANANTPEYKAIAVSFEEQLSSLITLTKPNSLEQAQPYYVQTDSPCNLDEQIALGVKNATQFRALIKGLNHKFAMMKIALQGNNQ